MWSYGGVYYILEGQGLEKKPTSYQAEKSLIRGNEVGNL